MTRAQCRTAIRASTDEDATGGESEDLPVPTSVLDSWIDLEHKNLRRELFAVAPELYSSLSSTQVLTAGLFTLTAPADLERLIRLERLYGTTWQAIERSDGLNPQLSEVLNWREQGSSFLVAPEARAAGSYRFVYVAQTATISADGTSLSVPAGCEDVIVERVAARVRTRTRKDPAPHLELADRIWAAQRRLLQKRHGNHPRVGLRIVRGW